MWRILDAIFKQFSIPQNSKSSCLLKKTKQIKRGKIMKNRHNNSTRNDEIPAGIFCGGDEIPSGTFHGGDEIPSGTFQGGDEIPSGTFHGGDEIPPGTFR
jgi:hypothetical protein